MHPILKTEFDNEMRLARELYAAREWKKCFYHLERAPIGNTGGANVGILQPMPIPDDLAVIFQRAGM